MMGPITATPSPPSVLPGTDGTKAPLPGTLWSSSAKLA
jgi:hypothetical protein